MSSNKPAGYAYTVLGVAKDADDGAIKKAYRKLIGKYHPDRRHKLSENELANADEMAAEINQAYNLLGDAENKKLYDSGDLTFEGVKKAPTSFARPDRTGWSMDDVFGEFMSVGKEGRGERPEKTEREKPRRTAARRPEGGRPKKTEPARHADVKCRLSVAFEEAALGASKRIRVNKDKIVAIKLPEGTTDGQHLRVRGHGNEVGGKKGDLLVEIRVNAHDMFERHGDDITMEVDVELEDVVLGTTIEVPTLHGTEEITLERGQNPNKSICIKGAGIRGGDQFVTVNVLLPDQMDDSLLDLLTPWAEERRGIKPQQTPQQQAFKR